MFEKKLRVTVDIPFRDQFENNDKVSLKDMKDNIIAGEEAILDGVSIIRDNIDTYESDDNYFLDDRIAKIVNTAIILEG